MTREYETFKPLPRVVIYGLASDFGCQVQMTNIEDHLLEVLGQFELGYWQLVSSGEIPETYDVLVVEGAVTTKEHEAFLLDARKKAAVVIAIGSCAVTGGIPGLAQDDMDARMASVYGITPTATGQYESPRPVRSIIDVDYSVPGCPIEPLEFVAVLQKALAGISRDIPAGTLCGSCRLNENPCLYSQGKVCLGLVTATGCNARCVSVGRPCNGCRGLAKDANLVSAREIVRRYGCDVGAFDAALELFNVSDSERIAEAKARGLENMSEYEEVR